MVSALLGFPRAYLCLLIWLPLLAKTVSTVLVVATIAVTALVSLPRLLGPLSLLARGTPRPHRCPPAALRAAERAIQGRGADSGIDSASRYVVAVYGIKLKVKNLYELQFKVV